jgi:flagellar protein FlaG
MSSSISNNVSANNLQSATNYQQMSQAPSSSDLKDVVAQAVEVSSFKPSNVVRASKPTQEVVAQAAQQLENFVSSMGRNLSFSVDQTTGFHVVTVVNPNTGEVIRQLPSKELLDIAQTMSQLKNALVSQKA